MFDIFNNIFESFKEFINDIAQVFIDLGTSAFDSMGISEQWNNLMNVEMIQSLFSYAPYTDLLINWSVIVTSFTASFVIILSILIYKIIVKFIPTIY